jgi:hypothetical protein
MSFPPFVSLVGMEQSLNLDLIAAELFPGFRPQLLFPTAILLFPFFLV